MVKDIATVPVPSFSYPAYPLAITELDGVYYFASEDGIHGRELFRSDGTAEGTWLVKDICPGICGSVMSTMATMDDRLYFSADDGEHGLELWTSDGTASGTHLVLDSNPGPEGSNPDNFFAFDQKLLFRASSADGGSELWTSDGSAAGTSMIDVAPGPNSSYPVSFQRVGPWVVFGASDPSYRLWRTDGTSAGTTMVFDIAYGNDRTPPFRLLQSATLEGVLLFAIGAQIWRSDATAAGTVLISDTLGFSASSFVELGGYLYFGVTNWSIQGELWRTDGTTMGTTIVAGPFDGQVRPLAAEGGVLFLAINTIGTGLELWQSDGTAQGTVLLKDTNPGPSGGLTWGAQLDPVASNGLVYFMADDGIHGLELWRTDGSENGTFMLRDSWPGPGWGAADLFIHLCLPKATPDGILTLLNDGGPRWWEPWRSDGSVFGTRPVLDIDFQTSAIGAGFFLGGHRFERGAFGNRLAFAASDGFLGFEPWVTDGTSAGTFTLGDLNPGSSFDSSEPGRFAQIGAWLFFTALDPVDNGLAHLWKADGSPSGTSYVSDNAPDPWGGDAQNMVAFMDKLFFPRADGLWSSDGTDVGTDVAVSRPNVSDLLIDGQDLYFLSNARLYQTDGTEAGTNEVTEGLPDVHIEEMRLLAGTVYILWNGEPATTDGTPAGTHLIKDIRPGPEPSMTVPFAFPGVADNEVIAAAANRVVLVANDGTNGSELWATDAAEANTILVADIQPGPTGSGIRWLTTVADHVFFSANDGAHGIELWTSDGTAGGTFLVKDINPGSRGSLPSSLANVGGRLYFSATDGLNGKELWTSDGTPAGTHLVADLNPGMGSSSPEYLTVIGPNLYFTANDGTHGFEIWALAVPIIALTPSELGIDDLLGNSNGLWEFGESVKLQPVWENLSTSSITAVTAGASGTNGAQCTDSTASYGTFGPLDLRSCLSTGNCYAATLSGPRPSTHWDVTLHETLSTGKVYDWPIHIAGSFDDVAAGDAGYSDIEAYLHSNLTAGCSATSFCPQDVVTRAQAALFLSLGLEGGNANLVPFTGSVPGKGAYDCTDGGVSVFVDVAPDDPLCRFVHDLAAREITGGCESDSYCPDNALSRVQLGLLLGRALAEGPIPQSLSGPGGTYDCSLGTPNVHFTDVDENNPFCAAAHYLWARQISGGCGATTFCPDGAVVRSAIAPILVDAFELQLP